jgi:pimeloyl-ACP methyl ester carboxylesterase
MGSAPTTTIGTTITLRDGRILGYAESGDPAGTPVFVCHGTPGSRLDRHPDESIARGLGARLIVADRPGYGLSTFQRGRRLLDWPDDLGQLADALGIGRFAVVGISGGGPHAAACAYRIPERLTRVGLVAAAAPFDIPGAMEGMAKVNRRSIALTKVTPFPVLRLLYAVQVRSIQKRPEALIETLASQMPEADRAALANPAFRRTLLESVTEAYRQGGRGHAWEDHMFVGPWGFRARDIPAEVHLWQGEADTLVPPTMGRYYAAAIPNCVPTFLPGEGHLSVYVKCWRDVLAAMVR